MSTPRQTFHELLTDTRLKAGHTLETMSILMGLPAEEYEAIENGRYPDDEILRRVCTMMGWNLHDIKRQLVNEMISPAHAQHPGQLPQGDGRGAGARSAEGARAAGGPVPPLGRTAAPARKATTVKTLGQRMKEARESFGQPPEVAAMLLNVDVESYLRLESGQMMPNNDLLRRVSMTFGWNYHDMQGSLRGEQVLTLTPRFAAPPPSGNTAQAAKLKKILEDIEMLAARLPEADQNHALLQLELVRDTLRRLQKAAG